MIKCRAIAEQSMFVTAQGVLLPCCFIYVDGPDKITNLIKEEHFASLQETWKSDSPFPLCYRTCDSRTEGSTTNMVNFTNQWRNN